MRFIFDFDAEKCSACGACAIACMDQNDIDIEAGMEPYRKIYQLERPDARIYLTTACMHCPDAPCAEACHFACIKQDEETGLTTYDTIKCVGCRACARACPYDAISFRPTGQERPKVKMEKCHGCIERVKVGLDPACVHSCPTGALNWHWSEDQEEEYSLVSLCKEWKLADLVKNGMLPFTK